MLVIGSALTVLQFMASSASYTYPVAATRYLTGIYLAAPLMIAPLAAGIVAVWRWLARPASGETSPPRPTMSRFLGAGLLVAVVALQLAGIWHMAAAAADSANLGVPMGGRDRQLIGFLENHHHTRFYTGYWNCHKLAFESDQQLTCAVMRDADAFALGQNRVKAMALAVGRAPHPAYVVDTTNPSLASLPAQLAAHIASGDPRVADYRVAEVAGYLVYYSPDAP
jgi:hypothetical protein